MLPDVIQKHRTAILDRWLERAYRDIAPRSVPRADVLNELGQVIDELVSALRRDVIDERPRAVPAQPARQHGRQRFHVGYDIASVVREHLVLRQVILEVAAGVGYRPELPEVDAVDRFLFAVLAESASTYALERDREVSEQAERYIGFLAHELRNPLSSARLALSVLREQGRLAEGPAADSLARALEAMHDLLDGALDDYANRSAPRPTRSAFDLGPFLRDLLAEATADAASKAISTEVQLEAPIRIHADAKLLRSAVSNLLRNAIKFSRPGTGVRIEAKRGQGRISISVTDGCGGLPPGSVERLFDPFVQAGADRTGFGLGLAIARKVAEAHEGAIRVHDVPGTGCVFVLDLPDSADG